MFKRFALASALLSIASLCLGCAGDERHNQLTSEVNRLRAEAYQRTYEAAALRQMLDRVTVELRTREPVNMELVRRYGELANSFADVSKQCAAPAAREQESRLHASPPQGGAGRDPNQDARARQIDDRLFDDRH